MLSEKYLPLLKAIQAYEMRAHGSEAKDEPGPLFHQSTDDKILFVNLSDRDSWVTCLDALSSCRKIQQLKMLWRLCQRYFMEAVFFNHHDKDSQEILKFLNKGVVVLIRSQKIIIIDRLAGYVVQALRGKNRLEKYLLENEIRANKVLPKCTISVTFSHLDRQPYFFVQSYCPYSPSSYKIIKNDLLEDTIECLFNYYDYFGLEAIDSFQYIKRLHAVIVPALQGRKFQFDWAELQEIFEVVSAKVFKLAADCGNPPIYLTQTHGDLIPGHIVRPKKAQGPRFLLVDWAESHRYSIFHDIFYLQFQSYDTNFWDKFFFSGLDKYRRCYGSGWKKFCVSLESRVKLKMDVRYVDLNFLVCLLQELDHRLNRIHPGYLPFWVAQVKKIGVKTGE